MTLETKVIRLNLHLGSYCKTKPPYSEEEEEDGLECVDFSL